MNRDVLRCESVGRFFKMGPEQVEVLHDINFTIDPGELVSIVGSSGSGKTTLLNLLAGLDSPSVGEVYMADQAMSSLSDRRRALLRNQHMGFVFQFHHLLPEFTALENILLPQVIGGMKASESEPRAMHRPAELSGGERQRVAIARALINHPPVVLMDEPTGNLDDSTSEQVHELIMELNRDMDSSFIVVTHNQDWARQMPKQYVLKRGQLELLTA